MIQVFWLDYYSSIAPVSIRGEENARSAFALKFGSKANLCDNYNSLKNGSEQEERERQRRLGGDKLL